TLEEVEGAIQVAEEDLQSIKAEGIKDEVNQVRDMVDLVHKTLRAWRNIYPDVSPVRIDNPFIDPADGKNTPALISYCLALAVRIFENTARRGASLVLKMTKLFGMSLVTLGGDGLTLEQRATLSNIPESIRTVEKKFNLDVDFVPYAICPRCNHSYPPTYPDGPGTLPVYPKLCDERRVLKRKDAPNEQPVCGEPLLCYGKLIISFDYYSFFDWFGRFIALPGIEKYGERFCEEISSHREVPSTKRDATDGRFVHEFRGADGKLFISERGGEGRWLFVLSLDYFNVEGNRIRGRSFSTGLMAMSCLNLPLSMRNDPAFVYIPALYHCKDGHEPDSKNAETRHFLKPLVDEFLVGYTRGVRPYSTHESQKAQEDPYSRVFKFAISNGTMDSKAAKPANGLLDITSHIFCHRCNCWHAFHGGRTDCRNWVDIDDEYLRKGAQLWQDAEFSEDRKFVEDCFGTRASELWRLPYWKPSRQAVSEPMHTVYLNVVQRYCREILGLDNPNDKKKVHKMPKYTRCFYYPFEPPPALSSVSQSRGADSQEDRASLSAYRVGDIHRFLSQPLGDDHGHLRRLLDDATFDALMYVCVDLGRSPVAKCSKSVLIHELVTWRLAMPRTPLEPLKIDSPGLLRRLQQAVREVTTPSWLSKPPPDVGTPAAGTLKADHWRRLIEIHLPLAMLSLWNEQSPSAAGNAHLMVPALETTMHLTCAAILMSKLSLSVERREQFRNHLIQHIEGIKQHFGGFIFPSHHLSLHISDFMEEFSGVRHWWSMPFESLGGKLQRIRTNHKAGEKQSTIHHSYCKSSSYRQWLLRPDCPPLLRYCLKLLDKAYNYDSREDDDETDAELDEDEPLPDNSIPSSRSFHALPTPPEVIQVVGSADVECLTRTPAERGDYTIPRGIAPGNSYICFNPNGGTSDGRWVAGQIQHIFRKHKGGPLSFIVKRSLEVKLEQFSRFWDDGFEAKTVSDQFSDQLEIIPFSDVIAHSARWNISEHVVVVLSL
ncbi:hypothetical protein C8R42DRAFT_563696, partial [Lentinula raphanica]